MADDNPVSREIFVNAPAKDVFGYFTDPALMVTWMGIEASLEPYAGGIFRVDVNGSNVALGRYLEVVPHHRVVFTWGWEGDEEGVTPGSTVVEVTFEERTGGTFLRLVHRGLIPDERVRFDAGWGYFLDLLATAVQAASNVRS